MGALNYSRWLRIVPVASAVLTGAALLALVSIFREGGLTAGLAGVGLIVIFWACVLVSNWQLAKGTKTVDEMLRGRPAPLRKKLLSWLVYFVVLAPTLVLFFLILDRVNLVLCISFYNCVAMGALSMQLLYPWLRLKAADAESDGVRYRLPPG